MVRVLRCLFHDVVKLRLSAIIDQHVNGHAHFVSRYGCSVEPASIGEFEEVVTGLDRGILPGNIEAPCSIAHALKRLFSLDRGQLQEAA